MNKPINLHYFYSYKHIFYFFLFFLPFYFSVFYSPAQFIFLGLGPAQPIWMSLAQPARPSQWPGWAASKRTREVNSRVPLNCAKVIKLPSHSVLATQIRKTKMEGNGVPAMLVVIFTCLIRFLLVSLLLL